MTNRNVGLASCIVIGLLGLSVSGCAGVRSIQQAFARNQVEDVAPLREKRKAELAREFDQKRDDAQFNAAVSCWQRGDVEACQQMLSQMLQRNPRHRQARLLLADAYLFHGDLEQSLAELSQAVAQHPQDAAAQHALAQAFDASGRRGEALTHYERATQLQPADEVYSLSYKTALGLIPASAPRGLPASETKQADWRLSDNDRNRVGPPLHGSSSNIKDWVQQVQFDSPADSEEEPPAEAQSSAASTLVEVGPDTPPLQPIPAGPEKVGPGIVLSTTVAASSDSAASQSVQPVAHWEEVPTLPTTQPATPAVQPAPSATPVSSPVKPHSQHNPLQRAVDALAQGDAEGAIDAATHGLVRTPNEAAALYRVLGAAHYRRGEYQAAQAALAQALSLDKSNALAYFLMGSTLAKMDEHEAAQKYLDQAARLDARFAD